MGITKTFPSYYSLEAENRRLSHQLGLAHSSVQRGHQYGPNEEVQLLRAQV